jgi:hypothetical protein
MLQIIIYFGIFRINKQIYIVGCNFEQINLVFINKSWYNNLKSKHIIHKLLPISEQSRRAMHLSLLMLVLFCVLLRVVCLLFDIHQ